MMRLSEALVLVADLGAQWVLWLLVALSVISMATIFDRAWFFWKRRFDADELARQALHCLRTGELARARAALARFDTSECVVLSAGFALAEHGAGPAYEMMQAAREREVVRMERHLQVLSIVGGVAPLLGIVGTLIGLVGVFNEPPAAETSDWLAAAAPQLAESLVIAAVGLCVAVPAFVALRIFQRMVQAKTLQIDAVVHLVLSQLHIQDRARDEARQQPATQAA